MHFLGKSFINLKILERDKDKTIGGLEKYERMCPGG